MRKPGTDNDNVQMSDVLCDFCRAEWTDDLQMVENGVYPVLLNVNGTTGGGHRRRVGELATYLVQQPALPTGRTTVAWLWPLVERSHRDASGAFADDEAVTISFERP